MSQSITKTIKCEIQTPTECVICTFESKTHPATNIKKKKKRNAKRKKAYTDAIEGENGRATNI